jgi:hypothetical protein
LRSINQYSEYSAPHAHARPEHPVHGATDSRQNRPYRKADESREERPLANLPRLFISARETQNVMTPTGGIIKDMIYTRYFTQLNIFDLLTLNFS